MLIVSAGHSGDAATKPEPAEPITNDGSPSNFMHDPKRRLPYSRPGHIYPSGIQISPPGEARTRLRLMTIKAAKVHDHMLASPVHQLGVTMTAYASSPVIAPGQKVETFRYWRMCAWAGPAFLFVFFVFWGLLGGNIPPIPANSPATTLANHYRGDANLIRIGMGVAMTFVVLYVIWGLAFTKVIERGIERGTDNNVLSTLQLWGAGLTVVPLLIGSAFWLTGSYRPESLDPSILQLYYDMPWLLINLAYSVTTVQMCAMGVAFLKDKRETPLYPRW